MNADAIARLRKALPDTPGIRRLLDSHERLREQFEAAFSLLWMAENYAEGGGSRGPEMRDYREAMATITGEPQEEE